MEKYILLFVAVILMTSCSNNRTNEKRMEKEKTSSPEAQSAKTGTPIIPGKNDVISSFSLTVSESKRLIAKGIAQHPRVKQKMKSGMIIITLGTTNTYIAEELTGLSAAHGAFMIGHIARKSVTIDGKRIPEIILVDGKQVKISFMDALAALKEGDLVFKGGNLLNYEKRQAAVTIGAPDGGTVGRIQPYTAEGPAHLIVPIGMEKEVYGDLHDYEQILSQDIPKKVPYLALLYIKMQRFSQR